jgi:hypothetical protein
VRRGQVFYPFGGLFGGDAQGQFDIKPTDMILPVFVVAKVGVFGIAPGKYGLRTVEGGVLWQIGIGAAHPIFDGIIDFYRFAYGVAVAEEGLGQGLGDEDRGRIFCRVGVAAQHPEAEHPRKVVLGSEGDAADGLVPVVEETVAAGVRQGNAAEEVLVLGMEGAAQGHHDRPKGIEILFFGGVIQTHVEHAGGEAAMVGGVVIEVGFVRDPETDEKGDGHADGETGDIDGGVAPVFQEVAPGEENVVLEHTYNIGVAAVQPKKCRFS